MMGIRIRGKLVITLVIAGVIPLVIALSIIYFVEIKQRRETIGSSFQQMSKEARENIMLRLAASVRAMRNLAVLPITVGTLRDTSVISHISPKIVTWQIEDIERQWPDLEEEDQLLRDILQNGLADTFNAFRSVESAFGEIFATDAAGRLVASTDKTTDYWQADEEWWKNAYNNGYGQLHISEIEYDESVQAYSTGICVPVMAIEDGKERVVGIIKGVLAVSHIFESVFKINVAEGGRGVLASDSGQIILARDLPPLQYPLPQGVRPSTSLGDSGSFVSDIQGGSDMLVGFARIELNHADFSFKTPWSVIVYQESDYAFAPLTRLLWYVGGAGAAFILVFFFIGMFLAESSVISPLRLLTQTVRRVASGDLTRTVEINSKDEIGDLTTSFNQMVSNLEKRISLDDMSLNMLSHLELSDVLSMTMETLRTTFGAAFARIWLVGEGDLCDECIHAEICPNKEKCLHLKVTVGIYARDEEYLRVPLGELRVGKMAEIGKPSLINNLVSEESVHNAEWLQARWITSFAGYPLLSGSEVLGAMAIFRRDNISDEEFIILGSFADRAAMAIQNARLHTEVRGLNLNLEQKVDERTEELEFANVKLRRADQLKSEFLANMSHELRTPLNAIIGFSEVLRDGLCGELNEDQMQSVLDIHGSGKHLLEMINDILDLSKVEAGKMELQLDEFSLAETMGGIQSTVQDMANKKQLYLQLDIPEGLPNIYADHIKFKQIMYNLLSNAVKFTPKGGSVVASVSFSGNEFLISVIDTGIGVAPEDQETIFDEFRQVDSSLSRQYEGTGLGLALTKRLVELHGGKIWVESEGNGTGSKFSFVLPYVKPDTSIDEEKMLAITSASSEIAPADAYGSDAELREDAIGSGQVENISPSAKTILVVEDSPQASQLLCIYLNEAGYNTVVATDGDEAIRLAQEVKPFAITLDIMLPKKDGWQVMQELKKFEATQSIPIIIISIVDDQSFGFSMGAVGYLVKPIEKTQLESALENLVPAETTPKILVIDDNSEDIKLMETILSSEGFDVLTASNGVKGIAKVIQDKPDLIILDLLMPGMSGFDVVKTLQQHPLAKDIPIIICTMKELTAKDIEMLNSEVQSVVQKGEDAKLHLLETIKKIEQFYQS